MKQRHTTDPEIPHLNCQQDDPPPRRALADAGPEAPHVVFVVGIRYRSEEAIRGYSRAPSPRAGRVEAPCSSPRTKRAAWTRRRRSSGRAEAMVHDLPWRCRHLACADAALFYTGSTLPEAEQLAHVYRSATTPARPARHPRTAHHGFIDWDYRVDGKRSASPRQTSSGRAFRNHHGRWSQSTRGTPVRENAVSRLLVVDDVWGPTDVYEPTPRTTSPPAARRSSWVLPRTGWSRPGRWSGTGPDPAPAPGPRAGLIGRASAASSTRPWGAPATSSARTCAASSSTPSSGASSARTTSGKTSTSTSWATTARGRAASTTSSTSAPARRAPSACAACGVRDPSLDSVMARRARAIARATERRSPTRAGRSLEGLAFAPVRIGTLRVGLPKGLLRSRGWTVQSLLRERVRSAVGDELGSGNGCQHRDHGDGRRRGAHRHPRSVFTWSNSPVFEKLARAGAGDPGAARAGALVPSGQYLVLEDWVAPSSVIGSSPTPRLLRSPRGVSGPPAPGRDPPQAGPRTAHSCRVQDAWWVSEAVKALACDPRILELLQFLYQRAPIPFQTRASPSGASRRRTRTRSGFDSIPSMFMCGVWVALQDVGPDDGPVFYHPGSHKLPVVRMEQLGRLVHRDGNGGVAAGARTTTVISSTSGSSSRASGRLRDASRSRRAPS